MQINLSLHGYFRWKKLVSFSVTGYFSVLYFPIATNISLVIGPTRDKQMLFSVGLRTKLGSEVVSWRKINYLQEKRLKSLIKTVTTNAERQPTPNAHQHWGQTKPPPRGPTKIISIELEGWVFFRVQNSLLIGRFCRGALRTFLKLKFSGAFGENSHLRWLRDKIRSKLIYG